MLKPTATDNLVHRLIDDDGTFPNNAKLPLLLYKDAIALPTDRPARFIEDLFAANRWVGSWLNGIFGYHHYHSTAHEVLGVYSGRANVQFGGPNGPDFEVQAGDVVVIPAGVAHKNLGASSDFRVVGAYPTGQHWDMNYGKANERPQTDQNIVSVARPQRDPLLGENGPLLRLWPS